MLTRTLVLAAVLAPLATGCDGTGRRELSGTVTYDGKPLPSGTILFEPDATKGNDGPPGSATVTNGQYRTDPGKGVTGGPYRVRVQGGNGVNAGELNPHGSPLPPPTGEYRVNADLPQGGTFDVAIPPP
ncbi:hypothetical protein [Gemmata sp.]|uniref:hypothetical protein n=1 Tax=Gemmata sp. TaxID=1914242 RepID=UPI003F72DC3A